MNSFRSPVRVRAGIVDVDECDAIGELGVVVIARQQRAGLEVHFSLHMQQAVLPQSRPTPIPSSR